MAIVRSNGPDIVVRHAGRRVRVSSDWCEVSPDAMERLRSEGGDDLEEQEPGAVQPSPDSESGDPEKTEEKADEPTDESSEKKGKGKGSKK